MKTTQLWLRSVCTAVSLLVGQAYAQTYDVQYASPGIAPGLGIDGTITGPGTFVDYPSGVMNFIDAPGGAVVPNFQAFCVEPQEPIADGQLVTYTVGDISGLENSDIIGKLINMYLASAQDEPNAAAVQWAIWEITNEASSTYSLTEADGNVYIGNTDAANIAVRDLANSYLTGYGAYTALALTYLTSATQQNIVTWQTVPEPGALLLLGLSGVALIGRRRR